MAIMIFFIIIEYFQLQRISIWNPCEIWTKMKIQFSFKTTLNQLYLSLNTISSLLLMFLISMKLWNVKLTMKLNWLLLGGQLGVDHLEHLHEVPPGPHLQGQCPPWRLQSRDWEVCQESKAWIKGDEQCFKSWNKSWKYKTLKISSSKLLSKCQKFFQALSWKWHNFLLLIYLMYKF